MNDLDKILREGRWDLEDPAKRRLLMHLLCGGAVGLVSPRSVFSAASGKSKRKLKDDRSIYRLRGKVFVNGERANKKTRIRAGDTVKTGTRSRVIFAVGDDSFLLRSESEMQIGGSNFFVDSLRVLTGRLLSVFGKREAGRPLGLITSTATIGVRGTGVYTEVEPDLTYLCTCYGQVALSASDDPADSELIRSKSHDQPRYIASRAQNGSRIFEAPVINHTNEELQLLESVVGRRTPPGFGKESYER